MYSWSKLGWKCIPATMTDRPLRAFGRSAPLMIPSRRARRVESAAFRPTPTLECWRPKEPRLWEVEVQESEWVSLLALESDLVSRPALPPSLRERRNALRVGVSILISARARIGWPARKSASLLPLMPSAASRSMANMLAKAPGTTRATIGNSGPLKTLAPRSQLRRARAGERAR